MVRVKGVMRNKCFFPLSYNNVDIYYIELDSINTENGFIDKLSEVKTILNQMNNREYVILHLEGTKITKNILAEVMTFINGYKHKMKRLGIVGVHGLIYWKIRKSIKLIAFLDCFFCNDLQMAKDIIVGLIRKES